VYFLGDRTRPLGLSYRCHACRKQYLTDYYREHPHRRLSERTRMREYARSLRRAILLHYGGEHPTCGCCGEDHEEFLVVDHANNDGAEHRRTVGKGLRIYHWIMKHGFPPGFLILCHNCNSSFGIRGYCPHQPTIRRVKTNGRPSRFKGVPSENE